MDDPALPPADHRRALAGLARNNPRTGAAKLLWPPLRALAGTVSRPLRVLDVATGSGDIPLALAGYAARAGIRMEFAGCDISPVAVAEATRRVAGEPNLRYFVHDVLSRPLPDGYDAVTCSLFLHHLDEPDAIHLLGAMKAAAGRFVLVNDLARGRFNYLAVAVAARVLSRSPIVHVDGPLSVRAAFTVAEMAALADRAGLTGAVVRAKFPCRQLLTWERS
jgi:2-polyprenyl-3-methyl-5-hydroxy-6-metoxy-1,4-benzoquinol methylase